MKRRRRTNYRVSVLGKPPGDLVARVSALHALALSSRSLGEEANSRSNDPRSS